MLVEMGGGDDYPGDELIESGSGELAGVVEVADMVGHPCRRIGERVVGESERPVFTRRFRRVGHVFGEAVIVKGFGTSGIF